ncbi:hypothetical protein Q7P35_007575 [Cladosporium inversicolor]
MLGHFMAAGIKLRSVIRLYRVNGSEETCGYENSTDALTFTTFSVPILSHCFNFADLFNGNTTRGFVNQTDNLAPNFRTRQEGIVWQLENMESFDPRANYSRILYRQNVYNPQDKRYDPGSYAWRRINIYGGPNCTESNPEGDNLLDCIASFTVMPGSFEKEDEQREHIDVWYFGNNSRRQSDAALRGFNYVLGNEKARKSVLG